MDNPGAKFIAAYAALHDFITSKPPEPFMTAAAQALQALAPLAASVQLVAERERAAGAKGQPDEDRGTMGHEKTKARIAPVPAPPRNGV